MHGRRCVVRDRLTQFLRLRCPTTGDTQAEDPGKRDSRGRGQVQGRRWQPQPKQRGQTHPPSAGVLHPAPEDGTGPARIAGDKGHPSLSEPLPSEANLSGNTFKDAQKLHFSSSPHAPQPGQADVKPTITSMNFPQSSCKAGFRIPASPATSLKPGVVTHTPCPAWRHLDRRPTGEVTKRSRANHLPNRLDSVICEPGSSPCGR